MVGSPTDNFFSGKVESFSFTDVRSGVWESVQELSPSEYEQEFISQSFGISLAMASIDAATSALLVGAPIEYSASEQQLAGKVFIYRYDGSGMFTFQVRPDVPDLCLMEHNGSHE